MSEAGEAANVNKLAAQTLREAVAWWKGEGEGGVDRFLKFEFFEGPANNPRQMCSSCNLRFHAQKIQGGEPDARASADSPVYRAAERAVIEGTSQGGLCGLNNDSTKEQMIERFEAAADKLDPREPVAAVG